MEKMHPAVRLLIEIVVFIVVWTAIQWLVATAIDHEAFVFDPVQHLVAPAVAATVVWAIDSRRPKDSDEKK